ncbi:MAG: hypothetical protein DA407_05440 [Bacteroidetes bacterium]|nr:MAG: hypothetical protein DA407_05440 [Bacteroidota bacterium]
MPKEYQSSQVLFHLRHKEYKLLLYSFSSYSVLIFGIFLTFRLIYNFSFKRILQI